MKCIATCTPSGARQALQKPGVYPFGYTTAVLEDRVYQMWYTSSLTCINQLPALTGETDKELAFLSSKETRLRFMPKFLSQESSQEAALTPNLGYPEYPDTLKRAERNAVPITFVKLRNPRHQFRQNGRGSGNFPRGID
ncbi:hypothetical protein J6590_085128 [Homalodisca vitripennis]|nr:hypothetical protein J6590_085128 [Homalodisca vitripennis]